MSNAWQEELLGNYKDGDSDDGTDGQPTAAASDATASEVESPVHVVPQDVANLLRGALPMGEGADDGDDSALASLRALEAAEGRSPPKPVAGRPGAWQVNLQAGAAPQCQR